MGICDPCFEIYLNIVPISFVKNVSANLIQIFEMIYLSILPVLHIRIMKIGIFLYYKTVNIGTVSWAQWCNLLTLQLEQSGRVGSKPGRTSPLERNDKGLRTYGNR